MRKLHRLDYYRRMFLEVTSCLNLGNGDEEHVININLDVSFKEYVYKDTFEWDIVNPSNM